MRRLTLERMLDTRGPVAVILIRLLVGGVFLSEGIQKFLFPDTLGAGRFAAIGIPNPLFSGPFVGTVEIIGGLLILLGLCTRCATIPLLISMTVAVVSTKIPILVGHGYWGFADPGAKHGFWAMAHESRTDVAMLLGLAFLLVVGAGPRSLDTWIMRHLRREPV